MRKNQCFTSFVLLHVMNRTVGKSTKRHWSIMKDSFLSCFHKVDLTEEKWFWNHRREVCVLHMPLDTPSWWGECVTYSCMPESSAFHSLFVFSSLAILQKKTAVSKVQGYKKSDTGLKPKEGVLVLLYTPLALPLPSLPLHGTAAALYREEQTQHERRCF